MGKKKFIDKKKAVMFRLVPAVDKNNEHRIMIQYVENKNCKLSEDEKRKIIKGMSNESEFDVSQKKMVDTKYDGIPPEILERIRGMPDLLINQRGRGDDNIDDDDYDDIRMEEVDEAEQNQEDEELDVEEGEQDYYLEQEDEWVDDSDEDEEMVEEEVREEKEQPIKPPVFSNQDFPSLEQVGKNQQDQQKILAEQASKLTEEQKKILNSVLPEDYRKMKFKGITMKKFDEMGLPIDNGQTYDNLFSKGGGQIIAAVYSQTPPVTTPDVDYEEDQLPQEAKQVQECLNDKEGYEELEDDFFIKLMKQQNVKVEKQTKLKKATKKPIKKVQVKPPSDDDYEDEEITDQQLEQAMKQFDQHKEFSQTAPEQEKQDDYRPFHELSKKEKLRFMRTNRAKEPECVREEELQQKLNSFSHSIKPQEVHLRKIYPKLPLAQDICMQRTLQKEDSSIESPSEDSDEDDIVSHHTKNSTIFSNLNYVEEENKKKPKKVKKQTENEKQLRELPKPTFEKVKKDETKEQKKLRKQKLKQFKKERREIKKQFAQELKNEKKTVSNNANALLYGVSRIKIQ